MFVVFCSYVDAVFYVYLNISQGKPFLPFVSVFLLYFFCNSKQIKRANKGQRRLKTAKKGGQKNRTCYFCCFLAMLVLCFMCT